MELIPRHGIAVKEIKRRKSLARMVKQRASWLPRYNELVLISFLSA